MAFTNSIYKPLPFNDSNWKEGFWKDKEDLLTTTTLTEVYERMYDDKNSVSFKNFHIIANKTNEPYKGSTYWGDGDCYKWLEAATYVYSKNGDKELKTKIDKEIDAISKCQMEDGYIHTFVEMHKEAKPFTVKMYHEDYNFGHLFTFAAKHKELTNEDKIYDVALKAADLLYKKFIEGNVTTRTFGWNPSHIMGLIDLYRISKNKKHLELAEWFVNDKGANGVVYESGTNADMQGFASAGGDQNQERTPLIDEVQPEGHAVTATYLYCGATDICMEDKNEKLINALNKIYDRLNNKRVYITGGVGTYHFGYSSHRDPVHEAFARDYELPATTAYNETCANIGNAMWNWRMFLLEGNSKYADNLETIMYNSGISGMSYDGTKFRYTNPTKWRGEKQLLDSNDSLERWKNFGCYCCPPQVVRTIASMNQFIAAKGSNSLAFVLYGSSSINTIINNKKINIDIKSNLPWDGNVKIKILKKIDNFTLNFRIPKWSKNTKFKFNDEVIDVEPNSMYSLSKSFKEGDTININLDMSIQKYKSHYFVEAANNHMAFKRGPIVYALESIDTDGSDTFNGLSIKASEEFIPYFKKDLLGGVTVLEGNAQIESINEELYSPIETEFKKTIKIQMIPYYAWNNRGIGEMEVWIPRR
jgi:DUF1680 family protein